MAEFGVPQISTGDILRANIANGTELGKAAKTLMDQGKLVPDNLVNDMVAARLAQSDVSLGTFWTVFHARSCRPIGSIYKLKLP